MNLSFIHIEKVIISIIIDIISLSLKNTHDTTKISRLMIEINSHIFISNIRKHKICLFILIFNILNERGNETGNVEEQILIPILWSNDLYYPLKKCDFMES